MPEGKMNKQTAEMFMALGALFLNADKVPVASANPPGGTVYPRWVKRAGGRFTSMAHCTSAGKEKEVAEEWAKPEIIDPEREEMRRRNRVALGLPPEESKSDA